MNKIKNFWNIFLSSLKIAYNNIFKNPPKSNVQKWQDIEHINFLSIFVNTLTNLACGQATYELTRDTTRTEKLAELCKDLERKRYDITSPMLADGDFFVFPCTNNKGEIKHSYISQDKVRITEVDGEDIKEAYAIIDITTDWKGNTLYLLRKHSLDESGTLTISYDIVDSTLKPASVKKWEQWKDEKAKFINANHIGFGRYKSPANSRGFSPVYGVPLNFSCAEIEQKIRNDLKMIEDEFKNGKSVIFTDPRNLVKEKDLSGYRIADNVIPIQNRGGTTGGNVDIFNPELRQNPLYSNLVADLGMEEKTIGTSKGILTENETSYTATATAVKRANADTIALIDKIHNSLDEGNKMTLQADAVFLNIPFDLFSYQSDWYDPFEDPAEQWGRLVEAKQEGAAETSDMTKWLFPSISDDELQAKLERIRIENQSNAAIVADRIMRGE